MSKKIETVVDDIYDLLDKGEHKSNQDNLRIFEHEVVTAVAASLAQSKTPRATIRASSIGKACDRQQWYDLHGFGGIPLQSHTRMMFLYGHVIEALLLFLAREAGHDVSDIQKEVVVDGIKGHIDAIIDGVVVDVKSASPRSFDKFKDGTIKDDDPFGYGKQIDFYKTGLGARGTWKRGGFLAMDKQNGHLCWYESKNAPSGIGTRIEELKYLEKSDTSEPARHVRYVDVPDGRSGNRTLCVTCKYCSHKLNCWADANDGHGLRVFMYANGPKFLTEVAKLPKVDEVVV